MSNPSDNYDITAQKALQSAIGPAPWYWQSFPSIYGPSGKRYVWTIQESKARNVYFAALHREGKDDGYLLALGMYSRMFTLSPSMLGVWYQKDGLINLLCFNPDMLQTSSLDELSYGIGCNNRYCYTRSQPWAVMRISNSLEAGECKVDFDPSFLSIDELMVLVDYRPKYQTNVIVAIYVLNPRLQRIQVYPQEWFTKEAHYDTGYQWITRVTRNPVSKRIIGDGIRMAPFELMEDGCHYSRTLNYPD